MDKQTGRVSARKALAGIGLAALLSLSLAGCGGGTLTQQPPSAAAPLPQQLTTAQREAVHAGLKKIVESLAPDAAAPKAGLVTANAFKKSAGVNLQVCGDVRYQFTPAGETHTRPYFVELEQKAGKPVARRGQIGSDKLKRAKIKFICGKLGKA